MAVRNVVYYAPFTHYFAADVVRVLTLAAALMVFLSVAVLAVRRWREDRRSASLFLLALSTSLFVHAAAGMVGLGRPPTWPLLILRIVPVALTYLASFVVIGEAKRGVWARRIT